MPFTFLSHQAPVLPLKIAAPRWFDGTALAIGSMAPDLVFLTHGTDGYIDAHTIGPQFWFSLPLTLALSWLVKRRMAGPLAAHLPDCGEFHLRAYGRLSAWKQPRDARGWMVLITSAIIGSFSHLGFDSFTHGFGWVVQHVDALQTQAFVLPQWLTGRPVYVDDLLQLGGTVIGGAITIWCLRIIGSRRLLVDWYPDVEQLHPNWSSRQELTRSSVSGLGAGVVLAIATVHIGGAQDLIIRVADLTFVGVAIGSWRAGRTMI